MNLNDTVLLGRNFNEYVRMFNLNEDLLSNKILDVASGVSSFCAEGNAKGYSIIATDKIYNLKAEEIEDKCKRDLGIMEKHLKEKLKKRWEGLFHKLAYFLSFPFRKIEIEKMVRAFDPCFSCSTHFLQVNWNEK